jgi:heme/copper-type cytochrome/quinol oxidase subunit 4
MIQKAKLLFEELSTKFQVKKPWDIVIIFVLNVLVTIPAFLIAHQNLIDLEWIWHLDRIILFVLIIVIIQLVLRAMRKITLLSVFLYFNVSSI